MAAQKILEVVIQNIFNDDLSFEKHFSVDKFSFWSSIKNSFRKICDSRFSESIQRIYLLNQLFTKFDISKILQWAEVGQEEKECILVGKKFKVPSFMLQHGRYQNSKKWDLGPQMPINHIFWILFNSISIYSSIRF